MIQYSCCLAFICIQLCSVMYISGCSREQQNNQSAPPSADISKKNTLLTGSSVPGGVVAETKILSTFENISTLHQAVKKHNPKQKDGQSHMKPQELIVFSERGHGVAYVSVNGAREQVIHNGKRGNVYTGISKLSISPDGQRISYSCMLGEKQRLVIDNVATQIFDFVWEPVYSPDSRHVAYYADSLGTTRLVLDGKIIEENVAFKSNSLFTKDSAKVVYHMSANNEQGAVLVVYDLATGNKTYKEILATPIVMSNTTNRIFAAVKEGDRQRVIDFVVSKPDEVHTSGLYTAVGDMSVGIDGKSVAFIAVKGNSRYLVANGKETRLPLDMLIVAPPVLRPDLKGAGVILTSNDRHNKRSIFFQTMQSDGSNTKQYEQMKELVYGMDSKGSVSSAFTVKKGEKWLVVLNGKEGPDFDMVVTPMFSPDGSKLVYRARRGDKRLVVITDVAGNTARYMAEYDMVFMTVFTDDGKSVGYGVKEGNQLIWKVDKL